MPARVDLRARFAVIGMDPGARQQLGAGMIESVQRRWDRAEDVFDRKAPPLTKRYERRKQRRFPPAIRNLNATGELRDSMAVVIADPFRIEIGILSVQNQLKMYFNQFRSEQWGLSAVNRAEIIFLRSQLQVRNVIAERVA